MHTVQYVLPSLIYLVGRLTSQNVRFFLQNTINEGHLENRATSVSFILVDLQCRI